MSWPFFPMANFKNYLFCFIWWLLFHGFFYCRMIGKQKAVNLWMKTLNQFHPMILLLIQALPLATKISPEVLLFPKSISTLILHRFMQCSSLVETNLRISMQPLELWNPIERCRMQTGDANIHDSSLADTFHGLYRGTNPAEVWPSVNKFHGWIHFLL